MSLQNAMHRSHVSWQPFCAAIPVHSRVHCKQQQGCVRKQRRSSPVVNVSQKHSGESKLLHQRRAESSQASSPLQHQPITPAKPAKPATQKQKLHQFDLGLALAAALLPLQQNPALAFTIRQEPDNALSFPTWVIHISSVLEWTIAMALVWKYAEVTGNAKWKGLTWGMMPLLAGAICACTYHFFYNSPDLDFLVAVQASLTWIGNATCAAAAYQIYKSAQQEGAT